MQSMAGYRSNRMSENDMLVEMRRLRGELGPVREQMDRRRSSSFQTTGRTTGQLRNRACALMLAALALAVSGACWLVYRALSAVMGGVFDGIVPEPVHATVNAVVALVYALV